MLAIAMNHDKDFSPASEQKIIDIYEVFEKGSNESEPGAPTPFNVITALFDYMNTELTLEEKAMPNDREMAKHKKEHDKFRSTVMLYISMLQFGISPPTFEVRKFLENWISSHVAAPHAMLPG